MQRKTERYEVKLDPASCFECVQGTSNYKLISIKYPYIKGTNVRLRWTVTEIKQITTQKGGCNRFDVNIGSKIFC